MSGRKRKYGDIDPPKDDDLNQFQLTNKSFNDDLSSQEELSGSEATMKVFNDPVHGHFELHPLCTKIIDTPQFQRLRDIKQLGGCYLVFSGASHNRFEHSLGVCYLAGKLSITLCRKQPHLNITEEDLLCVKIAGLCHDLGHGPLSHLFDGMFMQELKPEKKWKHEQGSIAMLDYLIEQNNLWPEFKKWNLTRKDLIFIKEMIDGPSSMDKNNWQCKGRGPEKSYLYQIVANKKTGIDVDKWDYFARDCYHLGVSNNFDYRRYIKFARVIDSEGELQICTRDKEVGNLYDMFYTRSSLHRRAYQHKTARIIELMFSDALVKADPFLEIPGKDGNKVKLSDSVDDMVAYTNVSDSIFHVIQLSEDPKLDEAKSILQRIKKRDLYKLIGQVILKEKPKETKNQIINDILGRKRLTTSDFAVHVICFDYGMKEENPIDHVRFYCKNDKDKAVQIRRDQVSHMLPGKFAENCLRFYYKGNDPQIIEESTGCFGEWCERQECKPIDGKMLPEMTPSKNAKECISGKPAKPKFNLGQSDL